MSSSLLNSKRVLSVCMETTAGGRNYSGGLGALYGDTTRTMNRLGASFLAVTPIYKNGYVRQTVTKDGVIDEYPEQRFEDDYLYTGIVLDVPLLQRQLKVKIWKHKTLSNCYGVDSFLPENGDFAYITNNLYGENGVGGYDGEAQRLMQEVLLGVASIGICEKLNYPFDVLHNFLLYCSAYIIANVPHRKLIIINNRRDAPLSSISIPAAVPGHSAEAARPKASPGSLGSSLCKSHSVTGMLRLISS